MSNVDFEKQITKIRKLISKSNNPIMFYDTDTDGTTSYFQLKKVFPKIIGYPIERDEEKLQDLLRSLNEKHDLVIIFDVPVINETLLDFFKESKIIWADHHLNNDLSLLERYDIVHLNPLKYNKNDNRASSYLAYLVSNSKDNLFYAVWGSVGDFFLLDIIVELYEKDKESFNILFQISEDKRKELFSFIGKYKFDNTSIREKRDYWINYLRFDCNFMRFKNLIEFMFKEKDREVVISLINELSKLSPSEIEEGFISSKGNIFSRYDEYNSIYKKLLKKALKKEEKEYFLFEHTGEIGFSKTLSEELTYILKNSKVIIVAFRKKGKDYFQCSLRGKGVDVHTLLQNLIEGIDARGGGHKYAAGAGVNKNDFEEFKRRFLDYRI